MPSRIRNRYRKTRWTRPRMRAEALEGRRLLALMTSTLPIDTFDTADDSQDVKPAVAIAPEVSQAVRVASLAPQLAWLTPITGDTLELNVPYTSAVESSDMDFGLAGEDISEAIDVPHAPASGEASAVAPTEPVVPAELVPPAAREWAMEIQDRVAEFTRGSMQSRRVEPINVQSNFVSGGLSTSNSFLTGDPSVVEGGYETQGRPGGLFITDPSQDLNGANSNSVGILSGTSGDVAAGGDSFGDTAPLNLSSNPDPETTGAGTSSGSDTPGSGSLVDSLPETLDGHLDTDNGTGSELSTPAEDPQAGTVGLHVTFSSAHLQVIRNYEMAPFNLDPLAGAGAVVAGSPTTAPWQLGHALGHEPTPSDLTAASGPLSFDAAIAQMNSTDFLGMGPYMASNQQARYSGSDELGMLSTGSIFDPLLMPRWLLQARRVEPGADAKAQPPATSDTATPPAAPAADDAAMAPTYWRGSKIESLFAMLIGTYGAMVVNRRLANEDP